MSPVFVVAGVGVVLFCLGAGLVVQGRRWVEAMEGADSEAIQALGGAVRVFMGIGLLYGAKETAYPTGVHALGLTLVTIGVVILWIDPARFREWVDRWRAGSLLWRLRVGGVLSMILGVLLVSAAVAG